jgi:hypothetical protein
MILDKAIVSYMWWQKHKTKQKKSGQVTLQNKKKTIVLPKTL